MVKQAPPIITTEGAF